MIHTWNKKQKKKKKHESSAQAAPFTQQEVGSTAGLPVRDPPGLGITARLSTWTPVTASTGCEPAL